MPRLPSEFIAPTGPAKSLEEAVAPEQAFQTHKKAWERINALLMKDEHIEHMVVQGIASLKWNPGVMALTNRRIIIARPRWFSLRFSDLPWRLLFDAHLVEGLMGARLTLCGPNGLRFELSHLPKGAARQAYAFAQSLEEPVVEFRRQRHLEETRAAARGVAVESLHSSRPQSVPTAPLAPSPADALTTLKDLLERGLIEQDEYDAKRAEIMARL